MSRSGIYSLLVFGVFFSWITSGAITQFSMGVLSSSALGLIVGLSVALASIFAGVFFFVFRAIRKQFFGGVVEPGYRAGKKIAVVASLLLTVSIAGSVFQSYTVGKKQADATKAETRGKEAVARALAESKGKEKQRLASMTPEQRDAEAKEKDERVVAPIIRDGEAMLKRWRENEARAKASVVGKELTARTSMPITKQEWASVRARLSSIQETQPQYRKAQALLTAMNEEDKKAAVFVAATEAVARADARKDFAKNLERVFVEKRMNADVTASGPKNTVLTIKWVLASKVTANDISKSDILKQAEKSGFKKVILTDGYDFQWKWELAVGAG